LEDKEKYLGDEVFFHNYFAKSIVNIHYHVILILLVVNVKVIDAFIEHYKLTTPKDVRKDGSVFVERVINTFALENDGRTNSTVKLRMGGSRRGLDYITHELVRILCFHIVHNYLLQYAMHYY